MNDLKESKRCARALAFLLSVMFGSSLFISLWDEVEKASELQNETVSSADGEFDIDEGGFEFAAGTQSSAISLLSSTVADEGVSAVADTGNTKELFAETSDGYTNISWSWDWLDASSSWASGKAVSEYMTVTPDAEDARNATAECLKTFGEPIIITATRKDNRESASMRCDYLLKTADINSTNCAAWFVTTKYAGRYYVDQSSALVLDGYTPFVFTWNRERTNYTVQGEMTIAKLNFYSGDARKLVNAIKASQYFQSAQALISADFSVRTQTELVNGNFFSFDTVNYSGYGPDAVMTCNIKFSVGDFFICGAAGYEALKKTNPEAVKYLQWAVYDAFSNLTNVTTIKCYIGAQYKYQGKTYSSGIFQSMSMTELGFDFSNISTPA